VKGKVKVKQHTTSGKIEGRKNTEGIQQEVRKIEDRGNKKQITGSNAGRNRIIRKKKCYRKKEGRDLKSVENPNSQAYVGRRSAQEMPKWNADNEEPIINMSREAMYVFT